MKKICAACMVIVIITAALIANIDKTDICHMCHNKESHYCDTKRVQKHIWKVQKNIAQEIIVRIEKIDNLEIEKEEKASKEFYDIERKEKNRVQQARRIVDENDEQNICSKKVLKVR